MRRDDLHHRQQPITRDNAPAIDDPGGHLGGGDEQRLFRGGVWLNISECVSGRL
jgi:hypothetical protein